MIDDARVPGSEPRRRPLRPPRTILVPAAGRPPYLRLLEGLPGPESYVWVMHINVDSTEKPQAKQRLGLRIMR